MSQDRFEVRPVREYSGARYPSAWAKPPPVEEADPVSRIPKLVQIALALVLVAGLSLGIFGCLADYKSGDACELGLLPRNENGSCDPPDPDDDCLPGVLFCDYQDDLMVCNEDGQGWTTRDCDAHCQDLHGQHAWSVACDTAADDPCVCEYDIIDGDIAWCDPGSFICRDEMTVSFCIDERWEWEDHDCNDYCRETYGPDYTSLGCNAEAGDPCQCEYDIIGGIAAECTPGDLQCVDEGTALLCEDEWTWTEVECSTYCTDTYGEDYYSTGCDDAEEENVCGCEYGIVDGEPVP